MSEDISEHTYDLITEKMFLVVVLLLWHTVVIVFPYQIRCTLGYLPHFLNMMKNTVVD